MSRSFEDLSAEIVEACRRLHARNMLASADGNVSVRVSDEEILITPTAIAWSVARPELAELPSKCLSEVILACGRIPIVPYARPGTQLMGENLAPFLPECRVMILSRHGALSWGESLDEAYNGMERVKHSAQILRDAVALGGLTELPAQEVEALRELRHQLGYRTL